MKSVSTWQRPITVDFEVEAVDLVATSGKGFIKNSEAPIVGADVPAITDSVGSGYELDITINSTTYQLNSIVIAVTDDWDTIAGAIQTSLRAASSSTETVVIDDGAIVITSNISGANSKVVIAAGTDGTGDGDLLAVLGALTDFTVELEFVDGTSSFPAYNVGQKYEKGVLKNFVVSGLVVRDGTTKEDKTKGVVFEYLKDTGDIVFSSGLVNGDLVTFTGTFIKSN